MHGPSFLHDYIEFMIIMKMTVTRIKHIELSYHGVGTMKENDNNGNMTITHNDYNGN